MKLSIVQTILGLAVMLAAWIIVGWMLFGALDLHIASFPDGRSGTPMTGIIMGGGTMYTIARYASGVLFGLGLAVLCIGFLQRNGHRVGLALSQAIFGAAIVAMAVFIIGHSLPTSFTSRAWEGGEIFKRFFIFPGSPERTASILTVVAVMLGAAVLGVGITQFTKARKAAL